MLKGDLVLIWELDVNLELTLLYSSMLYWTFGIAGLMQYFSFENFMFHSCRCGFKPHSR